MEVIKEDVFRKQLKSGLCGGYLFFGEEDYLKSFSLRSARASICGDETFAVFNDVSIDPIDYTPSALLSALTPPPMMSDKKIVTVNGLAISAMKASEITDLCEVLATLSDYDYNVLIISVPAGLIDEGYLPKNPSNVFKQLSEYLTPVRFDSVTGARLVSWVGKHFAHHGVSASERVCSMLIDRCGKSMFILSSETEKLSYYVLSDGRTEVTPGDVENVTTETIDAGAFALTNAILDGKYAAALDALNFMKFRRIEPVVVLGEISSVISELVMIKALRSDGVSQLEISEFFKINPYKAKLYYSAAANKSDERLKRALSLCSVADLSIKSGQSGYTAIETLICTL
ncbi:MAG: DNA polymerase III subunit delta [Clostridia bacterium]|nr:DNA polymerase III subunit delta [Clostridia bacterium]